MSDIKFKLCCDICVDTLTGRTAKQAIFLESGLRAIYVSVDTIKDMVEFLKKNHVELDQK